MIETVLITLIVAKVKRYKIKYLFRTWTIIPIIIAELVAIYLQLGIFWGDYTLIAYTEYFRIGHTVMYLFSLVAFQLYKPALIGSATIAAGSMLNNFVIAQNGGKMPVYPTLSYWTGYVNPDTFEAVNDIHILGGAETKWKILTDYIDLGYCILSPGDVLIHFFVFIMLYYMIKETNLRYNPDFHGNSNI